MRPPLPEMPSASRTGSVGHAAGPPTTVATSAGEMLLAAAGVDAGEIFLHVRFLQRESAGSPPASRTAPGSVGQVAGGPTTVATPAGERPPTAAGVEAGETVFCLPSLPRRSIGSPPASGTAPGSVGQVAGRPTTVATLACEPPPAAAGVEAGEPFLHVRFLQRESAGSPPASRAAPGSVWAWHSHIFNWGARARAVVAN